MLPYVWLSFAIVSLWFPPHIALGRRATSAGKLPLRHVISAEALFRGVVQRRLQGEVLPDQTSRRALAGLAIASLVFGLAHYAGGVWSVVLATIAGVGYGWTFWRTNRIEASILAHFLVNTTHVLFFTHPARA